MEVGEVAIDAGYFGEPFMLYHLAPLIIGQEQATLRVDTVKHGSEASDCSVSSGTVHSRQCYKQRGSLDQRADGRRVAGTL